MIQKSLLMLSVSAMLSLTACVSATQTTSGVNRKQLMFVPQSVVESTAQSRYEQYAREAKANHTYITNSRLTEIMQVLIPYAEAMMSEKRKIDWQINANLNNYPNAVSVASGQIVVSTSFIIDPTFTDDELATLIAHEMAHIVRQHGREKASILNLGTFTGHNRNLELEADQLGLEIMTRAGYEPASAISFWQKTDQLIRRTEALMKKSERASAPPPLLSSHPQYEERLKRIQQYVIKMEALRDSLNTRNSSISATPVSVS